jgi:hypothetical protein
MDAADHAGRLNQIMALLKAAVVVMGLLILAGIAVVGVTLVNRMGGTSPSVATAGRIELPAGARVIETHVDGKTVMLRLAMPDGSARIAVYETSGKLVSMIELVETK